MKERIEAIIQKINCSETDAARIRDAFDTADAAHEHQLRSSGEPYIIHPLAVRKFWPISVLIRTRSLQDFCTMQLKIPIPRMHRLSRSSVSL